VERPGNAGLFCFSEHRDSIHSFFRHQQLVGPRLMHAVALFVQITKSGAPWNATVHQGAQRSALRNTVAHPPLRRFEWAGALRGTLGHRPAPSDCQRARDSTSAVVRACVSTNTGGATAAALAGAALSPRIPQGHEKRGQKSFERGIFDFGGAARAWVRQI
jgi:hypothetical protein